MILYNRHHIGILSYVYPKVSILIYFKGKSLHQRSSYNKNSNQNCTQASQGNLFFVKSHISLNMEGMKQTKVGNSPYNLFFFPDMLFFFLNLPHFSPLFYFFPSETQLSKAFLCQGIVVCQRSELQPGKRPWGTNPPCCPSCNNLDL